MKIIKIKKIYIFKATLFQNTNKISGDQIKVCNNKKFAKKKANRSQKCEPLEESFAFYNKTKKYKSNFKEKNHSVRNKIRSAISAPLVHKKPSAPLSTAAKSDSDTPEGRESRGAGPRHFSPLHGPTGRTLKRDTRS